MKVKQTNTGVLICVKHRCDVESQKGRLYCPKCQKERRTKLKQLH